MMQELTDKVTQKAIEGATKLIKDMYPYCGSYLSWDSNMAQFNDCTREIGASDPQIFDIMSDIENIAKGNRLSPNDIWFTLEEIIHKHYKHDVRLVDLTIDRVKAMATGQKCFLVYFPLIFERG